MYLPQIFLRNRVNHSSSSKIFIISFILTFLFSRSWFFNPDFNFIFNSSIILFIFYIYGSIVFHSEINYFINNCIINADIPIMNAFYDYNKLVNNIKYNLIKKLFVLFIILIIFNFF